MTPETRLLFLAAGGPENNSAIRDLLAHDLDWIEVCRIADREKAAPLLWRRIRSIAPDRVPSGAEAHLKKLARVVDFQMVYLEQLTTRSTAALDRAGIDYALLKGAALGCSVYGSFVERPMIDLDMLVTSANARGAVDALLSAGWVWRADKQLDGDFSHLHHLPALLDPNGLASLEIHTSVMPFGSPFDIATDAVLKSCRAIPFGETMVRVPDSAFLLLHTCTHFSWAHLFRQGGWRAFRDVQRITADPAFDWERFVALAENHHALTSCYWTFRLANQLMGVGIPDAVMSRLRPPVPGFMMRALDRHLALVLVPSGPNCPSVSLRRLMWLTAIMPRWSGHGTARPWIVLALRPEDRPSREGRAAVTSRGSWSKYWASLLLSTPARN
ncbi:MAG: nucleotidyltransferase family protein [Gemmatimonadaceae bacterium]